MNLQFGDSNFNTKVCHQRDDNEKKIKKNYNTLKINIKNLYEPF